MVQELEMVGECGDLILSCHCTRDPLHTDLFSPLQPRVADQKFGTESSRQYLPGLQLMKGRNPIWLEVK